MVDIVREIVEKDISQPSSYDHGNNQGHVEVFKLFFQLPETEVSYLFANQIITGKKPKDVHQSIPTDMEWAKAENNWIDVGESEKWHSRENGTC